jgi:predicted tellurium resistance membrane protein TerC
MLVGRLPPQRRNGTRLQGLALAILTRIALLLSLAWMMRLTQPLFTLMPELAACTESDHLTAALAVAGRDLILLLGGLFLLWKSAHEIHDSAEGDDGRHSPKT